MHHDGAGVGRIEELDLPNEPQQACGVAGDPVIRPAGEVEVPNLPDLVVTFLVRTIKGTSVKLQPFTFHYSVEQRYYAIKTRDLNQPKTL